MAMPDAIPFIQQIEESDQFRILQKLVDEDEATVDEALQHIHDLAMASIAEGRTPGDWYIHLSLLELAERTEPARHHKLVEFMRKLQKRTLIDPATGQPVMHDGSVLWVDLPSFGYTELEEWWQCGAVGSEDPGFPTDPTISHAHKLRFSNLNAFLAQLTEAAWAEVPYPAPQPAVLPNTISPIDMSTRAIWTMRQALEEEDDAGSGAEQHSTEVEASTAAVWAACEWFVYASDRLWAHVEAGLVYDGEEKGLHVESGMTYLSRGWRGFERDRWDVWEEKLRELEGACVDEESKARLRGALANMRRVREGVK